MRKEKIVKSFMRAFNKPILLWLLCHKPMHGYNLMKEFKRLTGRKLTSMAVYPFLHALEEKGYIVGTWLRTGKRRIIKSYKVTPKGKKLLASVKARLKPLKEIILGVMELRDLSTMGVSN